MSLQELEKIKERWAEENRLRMLDLSPTFKLFDKAQADVNFLLGMVMSLSHEHNVLVEENMKLKKTILMADEFKVSKV